MQRFYDVGEIILTDSHTMALRRFFILYSLFFILYSLLVFFSGFLCCYNTGLLLRLTSDLALVLSGDKK